MPLNRVRVLLLLATWALLACNAKQEESGSPVEEEAERVLKGIHGDHFEIVSIDGCEYLIYEHSARSNQGFGFMSHKGNCSNPVHICEPAATKSLDEENTPVNPEK